MIKYNRADGIFTVECEICGTEIEFEADNFISGIEQIKEDGWIIKKRDDKYFCFCCADCKERFINMEKFLEI